MIASENNIKQHQKNQPGIITWILPLLLLAVYVILAVQPDLRLAVPELAALTGTVVLLLGTILYWNENHNSGWPVWLIMAIALLIRLFFVVRPPELSDDIYRFLWDGLQLLSGNNPYSRPPADAAASTTALQEIRELINHPQLVTIYGPAAQFFFAFAFMFGGKVAGFKAALILVDLACCYMLCRLLHRLQMPASRSVLYAWHPLPVLEIAGSGHIDGVGLFFLLAALLCFVETKDALRPKISPWAAGLLCAGSFLVKLFPALFLPGFILLRPREKWRFSAAFALGLLLLSLPFLPDIINGLRTLKIYTANWEFSSFCFRTLRSWLNSALLARFILGAVFIIAAARLYLLFQQKKHTGNENEAQAMLKTFYVLAMLYLLLTPTLHPWYGLYLVIFLPFAAGPVGLLLSWSLFLSYQVLIPYTILGQWQENDFIPFLIWLGPVAALILKHICCFINNYKPKQHQRHNRPWCFPHRDQDDNRFQRRNDR